jgi:hypothetical protein
MKLKQDLKRMLDALAYQHESDFLPYQDKLQVLGVDLDIRDKAPLLPLITNRSAGRVAWLTDGTDCSLDYALEVCSRQQADLDLVLHGQALTDRNGVHSLQSSVTSAGIAHQSIELKGGTLSELTDYLTSQANLIYLVASIGNPLANALSENMSAAGKRLNIPLVLFAEKNSQSAMQP